MARITLRVSAGSWSADGMAAAMSTAMFQGWRPYLKSFSWAKVNGRSMAGM